MKNKVLLVVLLVIVIALMLFGIYFTKKTKIVEKFDNTIVSTITLDINPSLEVNLNKDNIVVEVKALNEDSKKIVDNKSFAKEKLEVVMEKLIDSLKENNYLSNEDNTILINVDSNNSQLSDLVKNETNKILESKQIQVDIIMQQIEVTDELKKIASDNNITISKAYYINEQIKDNEDLSFEDFTNLSIEEIKAKIDDLKEDNTNEEEQTIPKIDITNSENTQTSNSSNSNVGSIGQCERVQTNLTTEEVKNWVVSETNVWYANSVGVYAYLYNGVCTFRCDVVASGVEHSYMYNVTTKELTAHLTQNCSACEYEQVLDLANKYLSENLGLSANDVTMISAGSGGFGDKVSDYIYTYENKNYRIVFDRYTGTVTSFGEANF